MTLPMCMRRPVDTGGPRFVHAPACGLHSVEDTLLCACAGLWISPDSSQAAWELVAGGEISAPLPRLIITRPAHLCFASVDSLWSFTDVDRKVSAGS